MSRKHFSPEVIDLIVDELWDDLVVRVNTKQYMDLLLVNKAFKACLERRRKILWQAQAAVMLRARAGSRILRAFLNPLQNPYIPPLEHLAHLLSGDIYAQGTSNRTIAASLSLISLHWKRLDALIPSSDETWIFEDQERNVYASSRVAPLRTNGYIDSLWFLKTVSELKTPKVWSCGFVTIFKSVRWKYVLYNVDSKEHRSGRLRCVSAKFTTSHLEEESSSSSDSEFPRNFESSSDSAFSLASASSSGSDST
ncbi:hypothetical protein DFJ77DRAFT_292763 [Powellomyces hirtus]|nr:hypothetical protein DFJ77DRAFT_292763 [Powellomyces hirtus]